MAGLALVLSPGVAAASEPTTSEERDPLAAAESAQTTPKASEEVVGRTGPMAVTVTPYYDSRDFMTLNITTFTGRLPAGFNIWGFVDLHGDHDAGEERFDLSRYFVEYRLRWQAPAGWRAVGLEIELNDSPGQNNGLLRFGVNYRLQLPLLPGSWLQLRALPAQTRGESTQLSLIHFVKLASRWTVDGFTDLNIPWNGNTPRVVTESQLIWHASEFVGLAIEARYNGFEDAAANLDGFGVAAGVVVKL